MAEKKSRICDDLVVAGAGDVVVAGVVPFGIWIRQQQRRDSCW